MRFNQPLYNPMSYRPPSAANQASSMMGQASQTYGQMGQNRTTTQKEGKSIGGAMMAGLGGYAATGGPWGAAIGVGAYLFS